MRSWMSLIERTRPSEGKTLRSASRSMCAWPSIRPGVTVRLLRSSTRVAGAVCAAIAASGPTARILSPAMAIAWAIEERASMVMTLAFFRIRSAGGAARRSRAARLAPAPGCPRRHRCRDACACAHQKIATWNRSMSPWPPPASRAFIVGPKHIAAGLACGHGSNGLRGSVRGCLFLRASFSARLRIEAAALPIGQEARVLAAERGGAPEAALVSGRLRTS